MSTGGFFFSIGQYATGFAAPGLVSGSDSSLAVGFVSIGLVVDCSSCSVVGFPLLGMEEVTPVGFVITTGFAIPA